MLRLLKRRFVLLTTLTCALVAAHTATAQFITTWKTDNPGVSANNQIFLGTSGPGYNYRVDWVDVNNAAIFGFQSGITGPTILNLPATGTYQLTITGTYPRIPFGGGADGQKLLSVDHWGTNHWTTMAQAFNGCTNVVINATDAPDLSGVTSMNSMFYGAYSVNSDLSSWNVSTVTDMSFAFSFAKSFNGNISNWNVSNVTDMNAMFQHAEAFNQDISGWNVGSVSNFMQMFSGALTFNTNIGAWDVSNGTSMNNMFLGCTNFNQDLSNWNVGQVTDMGGMFSNATSFNQNLNTWNTSNVINMTSMFEGAIAFNGDIGAWNTSSVSDMFAMFMNATSFNKKLSAWNTVGVTNMSGMFYNASSFNQDVSGWNVANVTDMSYMFAGASAFSTNLSGWQVGSVQSMANMFQNATLFNSNISAWNVSLVNDMSLMFENAADFNQDLSGWNFANVTQMPGMFDNSGLSTANYDKLLNAWLAGPVQYSVAVGAAGITYCNAGPARAALIALNAWNITDAGHFCPSPVVDSFSPTAQAGSLLVVINGLNFTGATGVQFGGTPALYFNINSDIKITAGVGSGSSGSVTVIGPDGSGSLPGFTYIPPPTVSAFTPASSGAGATVTINGTNFIAVSNVFFGGQPAASFNVINTTTITAAPSISAGSGTVAVTTPAGTASLGGFTFLPPPSPFSTVPTSGTTGDIITISGTNFTGATAVAFGGIPATSFTVLDDNTITAVVGLGATGTVDVTGAGGLGAGPDFTYIPVPIISAFSPTMAPTGTTVTISGFNFSTVTSVDFGGTAASAFTIVDANTITAVVGSGSSGSVSVTSSDGTGTKGGFVYAPPPTLTSFLPTSGGQGTTVTLTGTGFTGATSVTIGGVPAAYTVVSSTQIDAVVGTGGSGNIIVTTPGGAVLLGVFTFIPAPILTSFTPAAATTGTIVTIDGSNLSGATSVTFGGTGAASFTVVSSFQLTAVVAAGSTGSVGVTTPGGTASLPGFTFGLPPAIVTFTPVLAGNGSIVTITGANFNLVSAVDFGGVPAANFTVISPTSIDAQLAGGSSGSITVTTAFGSATAGGFTFAPAPVVTSFNPTASGSGSTVTIAGTGFTGATSVSFGGVPAASFVVSSDNSIDALVGAGATGSVSVTTPGGSGNLAGYAFLPPPTITSFTPGSAATGSTVTITGTNFNGASTVSFGGTVAASFTIISSTTIDAVVGAGTSGAITVTTPGGTASLAGFNYIPVPQITSFTPTTGGAGTVVVVSGSGFTGATSVTFGGTAATAFTVTSATSISATVGPGTTGVVAVTTPGGTAQSSGAFTWTAPTIPVVKDGDNNTGNVIANGQPQAIDLGTTDKNKDITKAFSIENLSAAPITVTGVVLDNNQFSVVSQPTTILAGSFATLTLKLNASIPGTYTTQVTMNFSAGQFSFNATGTVLETDIEVFNAVTPNGDNAHEYLKILNIEKYPGNEVIILTRWGDEVYRMSNYQNTAPDKRFDGHGNVGGDRTLLDGTYYYVINLNNGKKHTGFLLLQR